MRNRNPSGLPGASPIPLGKSRWGLAATRKRAKRRHVWLLLAKLGFFIVFAFVLIWWLTRPAKTASIAITGHVRSFTLEVSCGERLLWDLPAGQIKHRGATPGSSAAQVSDATLSLSAGARVRVEASAVGALRLAVDSIESITKNCGQDSKSAFEVTVGGEPLPIDPTGYFYAETSVAPGAEAIAVSLPLKGRVVLGRPIQHGGGWKGRDSGAAESIFVTRRVLPAFSDERVNLGTDRLDDGSVLDTHACLDAAPDATTRCASGDLEPATGFFRVSPNKDLEVQIYARGPIGVRTFEGDRQYEVSIPNSSFAWQSEPVKYWLALLVLVIGFWEKLAKPLDETVVEAISEHPATAKRRGNG